MEPEREPTTVVRIFRKTFLLPVLFYRRFISPVLPACCRYTPTCSDYFMQAVEKHGIFKGSCLGLARIFRCNGYFRCAHDPVPETFSFALIRNQYRQFRTKNLQRK